MGSIDKTAKNIRLSVEYAEAQSNVRFKGWLKYREAAFDLEEGFGKAPELPELPFNESGLVRAEQAALSLWRSSDEAYSDVSLTLSQHFAYFIGEVFRRSFEGEWVNMPSEKQGPEAVDPLVDLPYKTSFTNPNFLLTIALNRRSGIEWSRVFQFAREDYEAWVASGRPERVLD